MIVPFERSFGAGSGGTVVGLSRVLDVLAMRTMVNL